jgi:glycosyltransferase involved in cell wall biosynthesis
MRLGYLIGDLNRGGSERQLVELASGMKARGHEVEVYAYTASGDYDEQLGARGVRVHVGSGGGRLAKVARIRAWAKVFRPDVLHGFMKRASSLAVLASIPERSFRVVASDFSTATYSRRVPALWGSLLLFHGAARVVTQTETNRRSLALLAPLLRHRIRIVRNGVDTERFRPATRRGAAGPFRFLCVGAVIGLKNPVRLVEAVAAAAARTELPFRLDWAGRFARGTAGERSAEYEEARDLAERLGLAGRISFLGEVQRVEDLYAQADALVHVSVQEGIPNAVVEAMASGLPLVVSRVSDLPLIVEEGRNGFVCEGSDSASIGEALLGMLQTPRPERGAMGARSRELAVRWFGPERFVDEYEALYREILGAA